MMYETTAGIPLADLLQQMNAWGWLSAALIFLVLELLFSGFFLIWIGAASAGVGVLLLIAPHTSWEVQYILFGILSVGGILGWRRYAKHNPPEKSDSPTLNRRGDALVGKTFTLVEAVTGGTGRVQVGDTTWSVVCDTDLPIDTTVKVIDVDGAVLKVEKK
ncbi:MAG: NfeD family protein [Alphaproteobacteria bacterium]